MVQAHKGAAMSFYKKIDRQAGQRVRRGAAKRRGVAGGRGLQMLARRLRYRRHLLLGERLERLCAGARHRARQAGGDRACLLGQGGARHGLAQDRIFPGRLSRILRRRMHGDLADRGLAASPLSGDARLRAGADRLRPGRSRARCRQRLCRRAARGRSASVAGGGRGADGRRGAREAGTASPQRR